MTCRMLRIVALPFLCLLLSSAAPITAAQPPASETAAKREARMAWWREARFGLFIHWGLYAVPAGEWKGQPVGGVGEWIMHIGRIPADEYETLLEQFNPVKFDANAWAKLAKRAGMQYLVITTKHHDGFALFDTASGSYDIMATPFKRDIMSELVEACRAEGIRIGWYHSILDWHHPDFLPKRDWQPPAPPGSDYERYKTHLYTQVREILTNYGPIDVMWFDGEWDDTWTHDDGWEMDAFVRDLQPGIIINNRVGKQRYLEGSFTPDTRFPGDFGTPEQTIPATGIPGVDWETCMTMNDTWGFKKADHNWKSVEDLLRKLADIASKGGNFLLNVGPTAEGLIPEPSVERLNAMGAWLKINGESIYGTMASPFSHLPWGRCTMKRMSEDVTRLYLHVFEWPGEGALKVPGIANDAVGAYLLGDSESRSLDVRRYEDALWIVTPGIAPDAIDSVVVLDVWGAPDVCDPPVFASDMSRFVGRIEVTVESDRDDAVVRYATGDSAEVNADSPEYEGPLMFAETTTLSVRHFRGRRGIPISGVRTMTFEKVTPRPAWEVLHPRHGVHYDYYERDCNVVADLSNVEPSGSGIAQELDISLRRREEHYGFRFLGLIKVPADGMYRFYFSSDDGATFAIGDQVVVDHDGIHAAFEKHGDIALEAGFHHFKILFFEKGGDESLELWIEGPDLPRQRVDGSMLYLSLGLPYESVTD